MMSPDPRRVTRVLWTAVASAARHRFHARSLPRDEPFSRARKRRRRYTLPAQSKTPREIPLDFGRCPTDSRNCETIMFNFRNLFGSGNKSKEAEGIRFLEFCEANFGGKPSTIHVLPSSKPGLPDISTFIWHDNPEPGIMTVVSYGLSLMRKKEWIKGRPELMLRVESKDEKWGFAVAAFIDMFREEKSFVYQTILTIDEPLTTESEMKGFFTFAPALSEPEKMTFSDTDGLPIHLSGFYPIYIEERDLLPRIGLEAFWKHERYDPMSVSRPNLAKLS